MQANSGGKSKKAENTGAVLAVLLGLLCLMAAGLAFSDWRYYASIQRDPVTVTGVLTDIGKDGISYEYEFEGNRFEGTDKRRNARGKWIGAPIEVTLSKSSPDKSSVNPGFLFSQSRLFGLFAVGLLGLSTVAAFFGLRRARLGPPPEVESAPKRKGSVTAATIFLAGFTLAISTAGLLAARLGGERDWLLQASSTLNRPGSAEQKVTALSASVERRLDHLATLGPLMMWMMLASVLVLVGVALAIVYFRNKRPTSPRS